MLAVAFANPDSSVSYRSQETDNAIAYVHFAQIPEIMTANEILGRFVHCFNVQVATGEEVLISSLAAVESGRHGTFRWAPSVTSNVCRQNPVE